MYGSKLGSLLFGAGRRHASEYVYNKNPHNLEKLTIGYKPQGWHLEKTGREYWHQLVVKSRARNVTASVVHFSGAIPVTASTKEWAIKKHLYGATDRAAYINLGRVLGRRCLETGITEVSCFIDAPEGGKVEALIQEFEKSGVTLKELPMYVNPKPSDPERPVKPWELVE